MNAFDLGRGVEQRSMEILRPFIQQRSFEGRYVVTSKGPLAKELQASVGDVLYNWDKEIILGIEIKAEETGKTGNFFLETWSNLNFEMRKVGWMLTLKTDFLFYHFLAEDELYILPFKKLWAWAFLCGNIYQYPERIQTKYNQLNQTVGRCVPINVLTEKLCLKPPFRPLAEQSYDADKDFGGSINDCLGAVRERKANGGAGWAPKQEADF